MNVSSALVEGFPGRSAYTSSKAAVSAFTKSLAVEWAKYDIQVNALAPGYIRTELSESTQERWGTVSR